MAEKKLTGIQTENTSGKSSRVSNILMAIHALFLVAAFIVIFKIIYIRSIQHIAAEIHDLFFRKTIFSKPCTKVIFTL